MDQAEVFDQRLLDQLQQGKVVQLAPKGISMTPFIRGGVDRVLVRKEDKIEVGDIVLACWGDKLILHRVYAVNGGRITLMGDGNLDGTEQVDRQDVLATVLQIVKPSGRCLKPCKAWLWRHTVSCRRIWLKIDRKTNKLFDRQQ